MQSDFYFCQGSSHSVCQDYAGAYKSNDERNIALISDGCSSAPNSDWGARLLVHDVAKQLLQSPAKMEDAFRIGAYLADSHRLALDLEEEALFATLGAVIGEDDCCRAGLYGDGFIVVRTRRQTLQVNEIEFTSGAPFYIAYTLRPKSVQNYMKLYGTAQMKLRCYEIDAKGVLIDDLGEQTVKYGVLCPAHELHLPKEDFDLVAVISDGLRSFTKKKETQTSLSTSPVSPNEVLAELFAFKNYSGQFVQRRCQKAFAEFAKRGWSHYDDFSMGVVYNG